MNNNSLKNIFFKYYTTFLFIIFLIAGSYFLFLAMRSENQDGLSLYLSKNILIETSILNSLKTQDKDFSLEIADLKQQIYDYEKKIKELEANLQSQTNISNDSNAMSENKSSQINELTKQINELRKLLAEKENEIAALKSAPKNEVRVVERIIEKTEPEETVSKKNIIKQEMILIPAGEFIYGPPGEEKKITLKKFFIDKYEVSNYMYAQFDKTHKYKDGEENLPVTNITYFEALAYAKSLNKRLPTEEEWEKAARGTDGRKYPWGNKFDNKKCNTLENDNFSLKNINEYADGASPYGILNMSGNVYEWTSTTSSDEKDLRVCRGGSYLNNKEFAQTFYRTFEKANARLSAVGFRCVKDAE
ncbi:MAG TPA: SUMF1/EgtB/PvdO family nonheme iron enzyme [bacterium]|nr:SUMF1/EgtB/PvdO family nonheme iron enzyme [bacterium]HPQ18370.1 SUMF1/EgtB/PvdO family nonheme iron enzyme [bacterium]